MTGSTPPKAGITPPFLTPADDRAAGVYLRVGYRKVGEMLHVSAQGPAR
ncbi:MULTISPECIES: hypothetical protein [Nonomuraea]|uniref:GNAT family N-acetyltransferase n=1 Tax=Nonomuraea salmonea TaxID=46181 RepID=A0ABV5P0D0_9ACTN